MRNPGGGDASLVTIARTQVSAIKGAMRERPIDSGGKGAKRDLMRIVPPDSHRKSHMERSVTRPRVPRHARLLSRTRWLHWRAALAGIWLQCGAHVPLS